MLDRRTRVCPKIWVWICISLALPAWAHDSARPRDDAQPIAEFPDVNGLKVLSVDLHTHSVFSDGHVWPSIRAEEAARDMIDGVAITEHLEWQPHIADIPHNDRNRSFEETRRAAENLDLLVIPGVEITRTGEPGHINAVFVQDANPLVQASGIKDYLPEHIFASEAQALAAAKAQSEPFAAAHKVDAKDDTRWAPFASREVYMTLVNYGVGATRDAREVLDAAAAQGAFTFWNHPSFEKSDSPITKFHKSAIKGGVLHGVEIANGQQYYPNAHRLALKHNLAFIGTSDVHQLIAWDYDRQKGQHRPVTLVLAEERSPEAIKKALFARRTIVWWNHTLIGRPAELQPLLESSVTLDGVQAGSWGRTRILLRNHSGADLQVTNVGDLALADSAGTFVLAGKSVTPIEVQLDRDKNTLELEVLNALLAPGKPAKLNYSFQAP